MTGRSSIASSTRIASAASFRSSRSASCRRRCRVIPRHAGISGNPATTTTTSIRGGHIHERLREVGRKWSSSGQALGRNKQAKSNGGGGKSRTGRTSATALHTENSKLYDYAADGVKRAADRQGRRAGSHRSERRAHAADSQELHRALPARHELRDRQDGIAARLRHLSREGRADGDRTRQPRRERDRDRELRAHERRQPASGDREWLLDRRGCAGAQERADRNRRIRSGSCAACPVRTNPSSAYRNGTVFSSYTAEQLAHV